MKITFGSDPEFMLKDNEGNLRSAIGIIPGTKDNRHSLKDGHSVYYDNVLAEVSIRPADSKESAVANFKECFSRAAAVAAPFIMVPQASSEYPADECQHEDALKFGCDPEFCAYDAVIINPPECPLLFRSGGGHVHIGYEGGADLKKGQMTQSEWEEANFTIAYDRIHVARMCDLFLGIPSLILDKDPTSAARRALYGSAGSHRPCKDYGVEYRAMSNFWLARPSLVELVYDLATIAAKAVVEDRVHDKIWDDEINPHEMRETINKAQTNKVAKFFKVIKKYTPAELVKRIEDEAAKPFDNNLYKNWEIKP